jgi:hypothetical protein
MCSPAVVHFERGALTAVEHKSFLRGSMSSFYVVLIGVSA